MIIVLLGASGSGKSTIENALVEKHNFNKIISVTTRSIRSTEINGRDYYFVSNSEFEEMLDAKQFAEYEEYSQNRFYGTLKTDYNAEETSEDKVVVLTPNGLRQLKRNCPDEKYFSVLVTASLGTRIKRYIDRCGVNEFNFDDKNEIAARVERDFGAFLGVEHEVDLVVNNDEGADISTLSQNIIKQINERMSKK